ncbi:MAG TPA: hypothetical protein DDY21_01985 [Candidatus Moranbacteria bacterium]|nr:hypothetical protein [Candidatus Moranbacteria bacterium]HCO99292.1 hypothetical protein [Candidatus Moranbacteria bacterium]
MLKNPAWNYLGERYTVNWAAIGVVFLMVAIAMFTDKRWAVGLICLSAAVGGAIVEYFSAKAFNAERKKHQTLQEQKQQQKKQLMIDFTKAVREYRGIILNNFSSRMSDEEDRTPIEGKIVEVFKASPSELRTEFLLLVLKVVGRPSSGCYDNNATSRLDNWLQKLAYERFDELERIQFS